MSSSSGSKAALFLDRDGTINVDHSYISTPDKIELIPGAAEAIAGARAQGLHIVVATNQSGIGRRFFEPADLIRIHRRLDECLAKYGAYIDRYAVCPHHPEEQCACRKPGVQLLEDAIVFDRLDRERSWMVGDSVTDILAGRAAGMRTALVLTGKGEQSRQDFEENPELRSRQPNFICQDLAAAVLQVLSEINSSSHS